MAYAIMGPQKMKLEHMFRMMAINIADKLSLDDCRKIAYVSAAMDDQVASPCCANFRLHVLTTLESRGLITPTKLDFLEDILGNLQRNDLLQLIEDYKKTSEYNAAMIQKSGTCTAAICPSDVDKDQYEKLYAEFLTQFSKLSTSMRVALESNNLTRMRLSFSAVAASTRKLSHTVKKTVSEIIDNCSSSNSSSRESSATASVENMQSPSPKSCSSSSEDLQRNPVPPLIMKNKIAPQSEDSQSMLSISSQSPSPSALTKEGRFICLISHPSRMPEDSGMATDDGTGTSDSGVGDMHQHTPSYNALKQLDPACRSSRDGSGDVCQGGDMPQVSTQGYMPLLIHQENLKPAKSNYMKMGDDASETS